MKKLTVFFILFYACSVFGESLLTAQKFPKTFEDLSFVAQMDFWRASYAPYEIVYDKNGVCVSGCAYPGITIKEDMAAVDEATEQMAVLIEDSVSTPDEPGYVVRPDIVIPTVKPEYAKDWCHNGLSYDLPLRYPVDMTNFKYRLTSDFGLRIIDNQTKFHPAVDIGTPTGTPVYATASGTVIAEGYDKKGGGYYIDIRHKNGLITQYLHLSEILVKKNQEVEACEKIALSGNSGAASKGAHLDYRVRFESNKNTYVDILCPCKTGNRSSETSGNNSYDMGCVHSLFNAKYKFVPYSSNSDVTKRSLWRVKYGHCMKENTDLLPDEVK